MNTIGNKVKAAAVLAGVPLGELSKIFGATQGNFTTRMKTGKFTLEELEKVADAIGAEFVCKFVFPNGSEV